MASRFSICPRHAENWIIQKIFQSPRIRTGDVSSQYYSGESVTEGHEQRVVVLTQYDPPELLLAFPISGLQEEQVGGTNVASKGFLLTKSFHIPVLYRRCAAQVQVVCVPDISAANQQIANCLFNRL